MIESTYKVEPYGGCLSLPEDDKQWYFFGNQDACKKAAATKLKETSFDRVFNKINPALNLLVLAVVVHVLVHYYAKDGVVPGIPYIAIGSLVLFVGTLVSLIVFRGEKGVLVRGFKNDEIHTLIAKHASNPRLKGTLAPTYEHEMGYLNALRLLDDPQAELEDYRLFSIDDVIYTLVYEKITALRQKTG